MYIQVYIRNIIKNKYEALPVVKFVLCEVQGLEGCCIFKTRRQFSL